MNHGPRVLAELADEAEIIFGGDLPLYQLPLVVAAELERQAEEIRAEAQFVGNGWGDRELFRAAQLYTKLRARAEVLRLASEELARHR